MTRFRNKRRPHPDGFPRRVGFSLVELLIVISIMGILAGIMLPQLNPSIHDQLLATARVIVADIDYARSLAVTNSSTYRLLFVAAENQYRLEHAGANPSLDALPSSPLRNPHDPPHQHINDLDDLPHAGPRVRLFAVVKLADTPQAVNDVEFEPLGGTTRSEETVVWLVSGSGTYRRFIPVHINPTTGLTSIGDFQAASPLLLEATVSVVELN